MSDLTTVMWKEWRELRAQSSDFGSVAVIVTVVVLLGVVAAMAAVAGPGIVRTPLIVLISATPIFVVLGPICEAFAGERERHTLETLMASRISTEALLIGKIAVNVLYPSGGVALLFVLLATGANLPSMGRQIVLPSPAIAVATFVLIPLMLVFTSTARVLVSLRSPTVRQAQSNLVVLLMGAAFALVLPFLIVRSVFPALLADMKRVAANPNLAMISLLAWCALLIVTNILMLLIARLRFQRERMIEIR